MKKNHLIFVAGLSCLFLVGRGTKTVPTDAIDTGMLFSGEQTLTGMQSGENIGDQNATMREEVTGENTNGSLSITGKATITTTTTTTGGNVSSDVTSLIKARASKPADDNKLTEDDIDLIDEIIQKIQNIGN